MLFSVQNYSHADHAVSRRKRPLVVAIKALKLIHGCECLHNLTYYEGFYANVISKYLIKYLFRLLWQEIQVNCSTALYTRVLSLITSFSSIFLNSSINGFFIIQQLKIILHMEYRKWRSEFYMYV